MDSNASEKETAQEKKHLVRHRKGGLYEVIGEAMHTETEETLVLYKPVDGSIIYARPADMFYDGRFQEV